MYKSTQHPIVRMDLSEVSAIVEHNRQEDQAKQKPELCISLEDIENDSEEGRIT